MDNTGRETNILTSRELKIDQLKKAFSQKIELILNGKSSGEFLGVENSHDYPELLKIWLNSSHLTVDEKNAVLSRMLEHENFHAVPALGKAELGIDVTYGINFIKNPNGDVGTVPCIQLKTPETINVLTPEGEEIALTLFEYVLNPVLMNVEQKFSEVDRQHIVRYLTLFKSFDQLYKNLMNIFKKLPEQEQSKILVLSNQTLD
ncbi:MAG: hypothetical protein ABI758_05835 [Candidatus Woesebacteria bacterium]